MDELVVHSLMVIPISYSLKPSHPVLWETCYVYGGNYHPCITFSKVSVSLGSVKTALFLSQSLFFHFPFRNVCIWAVCLAVCYFVSYEGKGWGYCFFLFAVFFFLMGTSSTQYYEHGNRGGRIPVSPHFYSFHLNYELTLQRKGISPLRIVILNALFSYYKYVPNCSSIFFMRLQLSICQHFQRLVKLSKFTIV